MCKAGDNLRPGETAVVYSAVEKDVITMEKMLEIDEIEFEVFERSIKRFGYCVDLTDDCWRATVNETHVDISKFQESGNI